MMGLRVLVVDDHSAFAEALAAWLGAEDDVDVVETCQTAAGALAAVDALQPDLVVLDVQLGPDDGIALGAQLHELHPDVGLAICTCVADPHRVADALRIGARAWITKDSTADELLDALRGVVRGECWIPPRLLATAVEDLISQRAGEDENAAKLKLLTDRESEVLRCMLEGLDREAIARLLFLSPNTVRTHTQNVLSKLGVHSSLEAVAFARRAGLRPQERSGPLHLA